jgi:hypothetical protein
MLSFREIFHPNKKLQFRKLKHIEAYFSSEFFDVVYLESPKRYKISIKINDKIDEINVLKTTPSVKETENGSINYPGYKFPLPYLVHFCKNPSLIQKEKIDE